MVPIPPPAARTLSLLLLLLAHTGGAAPATAVDDSPTRSERRELERALPEVYQRWLEEVATLITREERDTFLQLEKDYQRDAFIERFWAVRDPYPESARNEIRDDWEKRVVEARQSFGSLTDERSRYYLLNGSPALRMVDQCGILLWPTEVWIYPPDGRLRETVVLVFHQASALGKWRLWMPSDGLATLFQAASPFSDQQELAQQLTFTCLRNQEFAAGILHVWRRGPVDYTSTLARAQEPIATPSHEWVTTFNSQSTDLPAAAALLPGDIEIAYPGRRQSRTVVQATVGIPRQALQAAEIAGNRSYNFVLNGEVVRDGRLFDSFRYKFDLPEATVDSEAVPLVFERLLRAGTYQLIVKIEDLNGGGFLRLEEALAVPTIDAAEPLPDPTSDRLLAEANAALSTHDDTIRILAPRGTMQSGLIRFDTLTTGSAIRQVQFRLDDKLLLTKNRPPYSVELDLGQVPRTRELVAVAFDADGREIATDTALLNASPHRFAVRLLEPRRGARYERSLRAEAQVELPEGATLERVEFWLNEELVATLYQEPFTQPIVLPPGGEIAYVRAVAYQVDGNSTEELVFVNAPDNLEEVDVHFVELYATVVGRDNRPVQGLTADAFRVVEDGVAQQLSRFEQLTNLPIHVAVLLDVSASMEPHLVTARDAALQFFRDTVTPRDRASLIPFNDRPTLAVPMTNRLDQLGGGLAGLKAERGTSLYDAVVFSLFYFNGLTGQRALLLLSDGKDENSRFTFDQTLDFARRAGVAIYTIGLDIGRGEIETRRVLRQLAEETGGRSFHVREPGELAGVYAAIERELRSRYLLGYQSTNAAPSTKFRTVDVEVARSGLEVKTMRGYYP